MSICTQQIFLILICFQFCLTVPINYEDSSTTKTGQNHFENTQNLSQNLRLSPLDLQCFSNDQVPYGDRCYTLLTRGPCNAGEWLLLDVELATQKEPQLTAVCAEKQCKNNDIFWPADGYCYNVTEGNSPLCLDPSTYLHVDPFGEGICDCKTDGPYVRWFTSDKSISFKCFKTYTRGPCAKGFIIVKRGAQVFCEKDPCFNYQREDLQYVLWENDEKCYRLGSKGPCPDSKKLVIHPRSKQPACEASFIPLHLIVLPSVCKTDHTGECVNEIQLPNTSDKFTNQLLQLANDKKQKKKQR